MSNRPPLEEYIEGHGQFRDLINYPEIHPSLENKIEKHAMLSSCLDTIGDADRCLEAFLTVDIGKLNENDRYVYIYGVLQAFVVQQDSVRHLLDSLDIPSSLDSSSLESLKNIREIRNRVVGHPAKTGTDEGNTFNFIPRNKIKNKEFQLNAYYMVENQLEFKSETINVHNFVTTQRQILIGVLKEVSKILKKRRQTP